MSVVASTSSPSSLTIDVFDGGLSQGSWRRLRDSIQRHPDPPCLNFRPFPVDKLKGLYLPDWANALTYARLFYPHLMNEPRVLHLDVDLLVFRDVLRIEDIDIQGLAGAASLNQDGDHLGFDLDAPSCEKLRLAPDSPYFNMGVFWMNLDHWREHRIAEECLEFIRRYNPKYVDQTAINACANAQILELDSGWNRLVNRVELAELVEPSSILHYTSQKPWLLRDESPGVCLYEKFCEDTGLELGKTPETRSVWDRVEPLNLLRGIAYRTLGVIQTLRGRSTRAQAYHEAGKHWTSWFFNRKSRKRLHAEARQLIRSKNHTPDWLL